MLFVKRLLTMLTFNKLFKYECGYLDIDQGDISKIEKGIGNPTIGKINRLFRALGKRISITLL